MSEQRTKSASPYIRAGQFLGWQRIGSNSVITLVSQFVLVPAICVLVLTGVGGENMSLSLVSTLLFGCLVTYLALYVGALLVAFILTPSPQRERHVD